MKQTLLLTALAASALSTHANEIVWDGSNAQLQSYLNIAYNCQLKDQPEAQVTLEDYLMLGLKPATPDNPVEITYTLSLKEEIPGDLAIRIEQSYNIKGANPNLRHYIRFDKSSGRNSVRTFQYDDQDNERLHIPVTPEQFEPSLYLERYWPDVCSLKYPKE